jgi:peroxiredoxin
MRKSLLSFGEPAPWFVAPCTTNPAFHFDTIGGRYIALCFFQSAARGDSQRILDDILQSRAVFDDRNACFFGVSTDPDDQQRVHEQIPGIRFFWDFDQAISRAFGAADVPLAGTETASGSYAAHTLLLDPQLRFVSAIPFDDSPQTHAKRLIDALAALPRVGEPVRATVQAPVLVLPRVFEPELCRLLIQYYETNGGRDSGFMRERDGLTVEVTDYSHKRRRDQEILDEKLRHSCMTRIHDRLLPQIHKALQFRATRIERYVVSCYDATEGGHFRAHRDNTTKGTAHRRFAVSLHLNSGEYEGGYLRFPEFGSQLYAAPQGGAVVFSCSLLHEATAVTKGRRFMFLPFLYDDEAARIRDQNREFVRLSSTQAPSAP